MRIWSAEVIVVAVVILILLLIVSPALLYKREQARQMMKQDRLKQVGMSLNSYHDTFRAFPAGPTANKQPARKRESKSELISPL